MVARESRHVRVSPASGGIASTLRAGRSAVRRLGQCRKEAAKLWRRRVRQVQYWRMSLLMFLFLAVEIVSAWVLTTVDLNAFGVLFPSVQAITEIFLGLVRFLGFGIIALEVLWIYVYALLAFQFLLPGWAALLLSGALLIVDRLFQFKLALLKMAGWVQPPADRQAYERFVDWADPALMLLGTISTVLIAGLGLYVQVRITRGLFAKGAQFKDSPFFSSWAKPAKPMLTLRELAGSEPEPNAGESEERRSDESADEPPAAPEPPVSRAQAARTKERRRSHRKRQREARRRNRR